VVASIAIERRAASLDSTFSVSNTVGHNTPVDHVSAGKMELRPRPGVSGLPVKHRATSLDRKSAGINNVDDVTNETLVNPPSSATGVTRDGKFPPASSPQRAVGSGPPSPNPAVRVREEPTGRPKGTRPVAEGKPGKAATRAGELRPIDSL